MENQVICHEEKQIFQNALRDCLSSGLPVIVDGEFLSEKTLADSPLLREDAEWEGCCLRDEEGHLLCLNFSRKPVRNTLLP